MTIKTKSGNTLSEWVLRHLLQGIAGWWWRVAWTLLAPSGQVHGRSHTIVTRDRHVTCVRLFFLILCTQNVSNSRAPFRANLFTTVPFFLLEQWRCDVAQISGYNSSDNK